MAHDSEPPLQPGTSGTLPQASPLVRLRTFYEAHPLLGNFLLLAPSMVAILLFSIQSAVMEPMQRLAIVIATILLAAACAWVISLADEPEEERDDPSP